MEQDNIKEAVLLLKAAGYYVLSPTELRKTETEEVNSLIVKSVKWALQCSYQIKKAGGSPEAIIRLIPDEVLISFVRNNLELKYYSGE